MSNIGTTDYLIEVGLGNIEGRSLVSVIAMGAASTSLRDIWGGTGDLVYPTGAETWEIVSDDTNDTSGGSGARTVFITYLDASYVEQTITATMNGTSAVTLNTDHFRPVSAVVVDSGSSDWNEGTISIRVSSGGDQRAVLTPTEGRSLDGHFTVPAGKKALFLQTFLILPKNLSGTLKGRFRDSTNANSTWVSTGDFPVYQNIVNFLVLAKFPIPEKTDFRVTSILDSGAGNATFISELLLTDI